MALGHRWRRLGLGGVDCMVRCQKGKSERQPGMVRGSGTSEVCVGVGGGYDVPS